MAGRDPAIFQLLGILITGRLIRASGEGEVGALALMVCLLRRVGLVPTSINIRILRRSTEWCWCLARISGGGGLCLEARQRSPPPSGQEPRVQASRHLLSVVHQMRATGERLLLEQVAIFYPI